MKKKLFSILILVICLSLLTGCMCKHETWNEADCVNPKTCAECGETEGAPLGHVWIAATCEAPKTCETCGVTEGDAKGHSWVEASCAAPKNCTACGLTEGEALEHIWEEATTEAPKTCTLCALTEGERIITDPRFTTASTKDLYGTWSTVFTLTAEHCGLTGYADPVADVTVSFEFTNDGTTFAEIDIPDVVAFRENMVAIATKITYDSLAEIGMDKDAADAFMQDELNMDMDTYVRSTFTEEYIAQFIEELHTTCNLQGVYYVSNGVLYSGDSWSSEMVEEPYTLNGDTLVLGSANAALEALGVNIELTFTRVTE